MRLLVFVLFVVISPFHLSANEDRPPINYDFLDLPQTRLFIDKMVVKHHFKRDYMVAVLRGAKLDQDTLARYTGRYKAGTTVGTWERFKAHVLDSQTLAKARKFKQQYRSTLQKAANEYHVDEDYIVGFIGVESKFGEFTGDYRLLDSLSTLAFFPNRMQRLFRSELEQFFLMCREEGFNPYKLEGSFAGAIGSVQQLPSVYRKFGMDYDRNGRKDPWSLHDSIGIIARFMHQNGWQRGRPAAVPAHIDGRGHPALKTGYKHAYLLPTLQRYGVAPQGRFDESKASLLKLHNDTHDEYWLGGHNFTVLTRYNASTNYGMAIRLIAHAVQ